MSMTSSKTKQRGISLIELMVAVVIGLIAILVLTQVFASVESRRRSTGGASGAQATGNLALFRIDQDVRLAGYGYADALALGCTVKFTDTDVPGNPVYSFNLQPVTITTDANGIDSITVVHGSSELLPLKRELIDSTTTTKKIKDRAGIRPGDAIVAVNRVATPFECGLFEVTSDSDADGQSITHDSATTYTTAGGVTKKSHFNPTDNYSYAYTNGSGTSDGEIYNLGPSPRANVFSINSRNELTVADAISRSGSAVLAQNVVSMKAQYGTIADLANPGTISWGTAAPTTSDGWAQVRAIRVAILVRSGEFERPEHPSASIWNYVTPAAPASSFGTFAMKNLDGSSSAAEDSDVNWKNYRYRVYENVIPLVNMVWGRT